MHDGAIIVRRIARVWIIRTLTAGTDVARLCWRPLRDPIGADLLPVYVQSWTLHSTIWQRNLCLGVGTLLLVVDAENVSDLVNHAALVRDRIAPTEVDLCGATWRRVARTRVVVADFDAWLVA